MSTQNILAIKFFAPVIEQSANTLMQIIDEAVNKWVEAMCRKRCQEPLNFYAKL